MLVFVDESYYRIEDEYYLAIAGYGVREEQYRPLAAAIHQAKLEYFISDSDVDFAAPGAKEETRKRKVIVSGDVETAELRAKKLLTPRMLQWQREGGNAPGYSLVKRVLGAAAEQGVVTFGTLSVVSDVVAVQAPVGVLSRQYAFLLERIQEYVAAELPGGSAVLILDTVGDGSDLCLNRAVSDFLFRSVKGKRFRQIVPTPFCVVSQNTPGAQLADIIAHCMVQAILPVEQRKGLDELTRLVYDLAHRDERGRLRSIYRIWTKKTTDGGQ